MDFKSEKNPNIPQGESRSLKQFVVRLHFSGKVIMGSVLFGFGLLLVGAILLVIATGAQKTPPLQMTPGEKGSTLVYVGPGVMGVGGFLVVVGTAMCLMETRVLRKRRLTEASLLARADSAAPEPPGYFESKAGDNMTPHGVQECANEQNNVVSNIPQPNATPKEHEINLEAEIHTEKPLHQSWTAAEQDSNSGLTTSIYVEAKEEMDAEDQSGDDSTQFNTPPEQSDLLISEELNLQRDCPEETNNENPLCINDSTENSITH